MKNIIIIFMLLLLNSCYHSCKLECKLSNLSSKDLIIHYKSMTHLEDTVLIINSNSSKEIEKHGSPLDLNSVEQIHCTNQLHQLTAITTDSTQTLTKNWQNKNNWILTKDKDKNLATCIFEIEDGDLQ